MTEKKSLTPVHRWRLEHLRRLKEQYGTFQAIADAADVDVSYLSQVNNRTRRMGHETAERLERGLGLKVGSLSQPPGDDQSVSEERAEYEGADARLQRIIEAWPSLTREQKDKAVRDITGTERSNREILKQMLATGKKKTG